MPDAPILVVDDDPSIRATVSDVLDLEGYDVVTATNGAEALERVEQRRPALVLLDMRMPIMDGWGFARELVTRGLKLPILVMTAADNARAWADEIGADGYVAKPFDLNDLIAAVQRFKIEGRAAPSP
jgi:two-component system, chemotaxis family, chemotaxis protein CheY